MLRLIRKRKLGFLLACTILLLGAYLHIDRFVRCQRPAYTYDEAFAYAMDYMDGFSRRWDVGSYFPELIKVESPVDDDTWIFIFRGSNCTVGVMVSRCNGVEAGGTTGCNPR